MAQTSLFPWKLVLDMGSSSYWGLIKAQVRRQMGIINITKTYLYNVDPLKPHFYIVKLGFTGVYIIFLILAHKYRLWVLVLTSTHNLYFEHKYEKYQNFYLKIFSLFLVLKFSVYLNRLVFVMRDVLLIVYKIVVCWVHSNEYVQKKK